MAGRFPEMDKNFDWFLENYKEFRRKYGDALLLIHDRKIIGVYDDEDVATKEALKKYNYGEFNIQRCDGEDEPLIKCRIFTPFIL